MVVVQVAGQTPLSAAWTIGQSFARSTADQVLYLATPHLGRFATAWLTPDIAPATVMRKLAGYLRQNTVAFGLAQVGSLEHTHFT